MTILFITGAGISAPSGIPTYRGDEDSKYNDPNFMAYVQAESLKDKDLREGVRKRLEDWKDLVSTKVPNEAHKLVRELLEQSGGVVLTQNVDDLHERAGIDPELVFHIHGSLFKGYREDYPDVLDVVLFGDELKIPTMEQDDLMLSADCVVLVGTSLTVPSPLQYINPDLPIYVIDRNADEVKSLIESVYGEVNVTSIQGDVVEGLRKFMEMRE